MAEWVQHIASQPLAGSLKRGVKGAGHSPLTGSIAYDDD